MNPFNKHRAPKLIGISGPFYSGKDMVANHLAKDKSFLHISTGDVLRDEATNLGKSHERGILSEIAIDLRDDYGSIGALVLRAIEIWQTQEDDFIGGLVINGLRVLGEAQEVKDQNGILLFIDTPVEIRYARMLKIASNADQIAKTMNIHSLEDFIEKERAEIEGLGGPEKPNIRGIQSISNIIYHNVGTEQECNRDIDDLLGLAT